MMMMIKTLGKIGWFWKISIPYSHGWLPSTYFDFQISKKQFCSFLTQCNLNFEIINPISFPDFQPFSKQKHSRMQNLPEKKSETCSSSLVKIIILLLICRANTLNTLALNTPWNPWIQINEEVCRVFQWPFACMNDPEIYRQICTQANKLFCTYFLGATDWTYT